MKRAPVLESGGNGKRYRGEDDFDEAGGGGGFEEEAEDFMLYEAGEGVEYDEEAAVARWSRGNAENFSDNSQSVCFQWVDIDLTSGEPLARNPSEGSAFVGSSEGPVPVIRLYGVTSRGTSVVASVHGFTPYFYASLPASVELSKGNLASIRSVLDQRLRDRARGEEKKISSFVLGVDKEAGKQSLLGYQFGTTRDFIKVYVAVPSLIPGLKRVIDEGFLVPGLGTLSGQTYESNVPFVLRFMIDNNISGSDWIEVPARTYSLRASQLHASRCSIELDVTFNNLRPHPSEGVYSSLAPMRILSFDIECQGRKGFFPEAQQDPVIQIANTVSLQGSDVPLFKNVFTLNTCLPIVGAQVICSATEEEMLLKWRQFVISVDPDILTGYNIASFDIPVPILTLLTNDSNPFPLPSIFLTARKLWRSGPRT